MAGWGCWPAREPCCGRAKSKESRSISSGSPISSSSSETSSMRGFDIVVINCFWEFGDGWLLKEICKVQGTFVSIHLRFWLWWGLLVGLDSLVDDNGDFYNNGLRTRLILICRRTKTLNSPVLMWLHPRTEGTTSPQQTSAVRAHSCGAGELTMNTLRLPLSFNAI